MINQLIRTGVNKGATTIHIVPGARPVFRVNGEAVTMMSDAVMRHDDVVETLNALFSESQWETLKREDALSFGYSVPELGRFRITVVKQRGSFALAIRILKLNIPDQDVLGLNATLYTLVARTRGLLLVGSASGMGKSTTIASLVQFINRSRQCVIMMLESPVDYLIRHDQAIVIQRDVGTDCVSFEQGLQDALLQDVDVVVISNLETEAAKDLALKIAESGKLVIAGVSAINTVSVLDNFIYSDQEQRRNSRKHKLATLLLGVFTQQLVPEIANDERVLAYELLLMNSVVRSHIIGENISEIHNTLIAGRRQGMMAMDYSLFELYQKQLISRETLETFCFDSELIARLERSL